jgi:hypothetical protein
MIMRIGALLTEAVVLFVAPYGVTEGHPRSMRPFDQFNPCDAFFISAVSPPLAPT